MATNTSKDNRNTNETTNTHEDTAQTEDTRAERDLNAVDSSEEVTPRNIQVPPNDEDKDRQNEVLKKDHIEAGFPADGVPRTDDERARMKEAGLL